MSVARLTPETARQRPASIQRYRYDRESQKSGIVHFGIGAFHRAHQAVYTDEAMDSGDANWCIDGVSLRSSSVRDQMAPQSGLFTVTERDGARDSVRLIGAVKRILVAPEEPEAVISAIASGDTRIVSFTITEKGYLRRADRTLDRWAPEIANDLNESNAPRSIYGFLHRALLRRRAAGLPGITLLSCDNLPDNGKQLKSLLVEFLESRDASLASWCAHECAFPSTMVDRIVPAPTAQHLAFAAAATGLRDDAAVVTERFRQWVIEDCFVGERPRWERHGAEFVTDVQPYETAKLRMLNGAHSALAYMGLARGHEFVHQAVADPELFSTINLLVREEAAKSFPPAHIQNLDAYADALFARFANTALPHRLAQIAMDGSQKIPQRWLAVLTDNEKAGRHCPSILDALSAWVTYTRGDRHRVDDPMSATLAAMWKTGGKSGVIEALFGPKGHFARHWVASDDEREHLTRMID